MYNRHEQKLLSHINKVIEDFPLKDFLEFTFQLLAIEIHTKKLKGLNYCISMASLISFFELDKNPPLIELSHKWFAEYKKLLISMVKSEPFVDVLGRFYVKNVMNEEQSFLESRALNRLKTYVSNKYHLQECISTKGYMNVSTLDTSDSLIFLETAMKNKYDYEKCIKLTVEGLYEYKIWFLLHFFHLNTINANAVLFFKKNTDKICLTTEEFKISN